MGESLYELTDKFKELEKLASDPDMKESVEDTMEGVEGEFNDKAIAIITVSQNMESDMKAIDDEIKRLKSRKQHISNNKERMIDYLRTNMESCGIDKISCPLFTITKIPARDIVIVDDEDSVPIEFVDITTSRKVKKKDVLNELKSGETVEGCHLAKSKPGIRIY